jgi:hypothetical protein
MLHWVDEPTDGPPPPISTCRGRVHFAFDCAVLALVGLVWLFLLFAPEWRW